MKPLDASQHRPLEGGPSFSLGNRVIRVVWGIAWLVLCRFTPPPLHGWRRLVLRAFGAKVGKRARVHASVNIWLPANLELGANALIGPRARIYNQAAIRIGERAIVSQDSTICASTHDVADPDFQLVLRPVEIGPRCWVAAEAFVGPGVTMNEGAVLGARGALFDDAESWTIYRGNPASAVKARRIRGS